MRTIKLCLITVCLLALLAQEGLAQKKKVTPVKKAPAKTTPVKPAPAKKTPAKEEKRDEADDVTKVKDMITFLEYVLNTLGSNATSTRDKDVLVTQSYAKIFRDGKVQVEDDLDDERAISTNKNIVAYLKDVDFFFDDVKFEFIVDEIKNGVSADGKTFYKVSLKRNLKGTTTDGKVVNNTIPRYVEVNYDPITQDLKIVSMYTHEIDPKASMINWWKELSLEWKDILKKQVNAPDSVSYEDIRNMTSITSLDLNHNTLIRNIDALSRMVNLQSLDISNTNITEIGAARNLTELTTVNLSYTSIKDLTPLKYSDKITKLNLHGIPAEDISVMEKMPAIQSLDLSMTGVADLGGLSTLTSLQYLDVSDTRVADLAPLQDLVQITDLRVTGTNVQVITPLIALKALQNLNLDSTQVSSVAALTGAVALKVLRINHTAVADLRPLLKLPALERIYCDHAQVKPEAVDAFVSVNPKVLIILDSEDTRAWWNSLAPEWQTAISKASHIGNNPTTEELARVPSLDSVNVAGMSAIKDLEPLRKLLKLRAVVANGTSIHDLSPLKDHLDIRYLDFSQTDIIDISILRQLTHLKILKADKTPIQNIDPLNNIVSLQRVYVDETALHDITAREFLEKNHACLLVFKTIHLKRWWSRLPPEWKASLTRSMGNDTTATRENLHRLAELETLTIKDAPVSDLSALSEFVRLRSLDFSGTAITDLTPLGTMTTLRVLHATNSPLQKLDALIELADLEDLDLSNTPVDDLKPIETLDKLTKLSCSGTQIKRLDYLDKLQHLEYLDCSNTKVGNLDPVNFLPLKTLKCYNTKISERAIEKFKKQNSTCNVVYYR